MGENEPDINDNKDTEKTRRIRIFDESSEELGVMLVSQLEKIKKILEEKQAREKTIFKSREPIAVIFPPIPAIHRCFALTNQKNTDRPSVNDLVLILDVKHKEILSGIIDAIKTVRKRKSEIKSENEPTTETILDIRLLFIHDNTLSTQSNIRRMISSESIVFKANTEEIIKVYGIPDKGLTIGICSANGDILQTGAGPLYYNLDSDLLKTHVCIGGLTGQGKTILLKNIIFDLAKKDFDVPVHSIIFDLQGDLLQIMKPMPEDLIPPKFRSLYQQFNLVPAGLESIITNSDVLFLKPFYVKVKGFLRMFPWRNFGLRSYHIKTGEDLCGFLPNLSGQGPSTLTALFTLFMNSNKQFNFEVFYVWILNNRMMTNKGKYQWYNPNTNESIEAASATGDAIIRELTKLHHMRILDTVEEINIEEMLAKKIVFIYFPHVDGYSNTRSIFLLDILKQIYSKKVIQGLDIKIQKKVPDEEGDTYKKENTNQNGDTFIPTNKPQPPMENSNLNSVSINHIIMIDEAHELLPSRLSKSDLSEDYFQYIEREFQKIAKEGRKFKISLVVASQLMAELNTVVEQNAQTKIFFQLSNRDIQNVKLDKEIISYFGSLKRGYAVVYSRDNLKIDNAMEIRILPPIFLHCDPDQATKLFEKEILAIMEVRGDQNEEETPKPEIPALLEQSENEQKPNDDLWADFQISKFKVPHVTEIGESTVLEIPSDKLMKVLEKAMNTANLVGDHFKTLLIRLVVALQSEETVGIKILGPSGEGKTILADAIVNTVCIGRNSAYFAVSEGTIEDDLFFGINPKVLTDKNASEYKPGVICQSLTKRTFPILDEANRAPERIYGGKALTALTGKRFIIMPGNQLVQAPPDWKMIFIMNPVDLGTFSFPVALENRLVTLKVPYANDLAAKKLLEQYLSESPDVIAAFVALRHLTMCVSPMDQEYHYVPANERKSAEIQLHGISMRIVYRFTQNFPKLLGLLHSKKEAFKECCEMYIDSVLVHKTQEEKDYYHKLVDEVIDRIQE